MPRYFLSTDDLHDTEGVEISHSKLRDEAISLAGAILRDLRASFGSGGWVMRVTDHMHRPVLTLRFSATEHAR
jgi:hypothetical protein